MDDLAIRSRLIRVAYANPDLRPRLLQALTAAAMPEPQFWRIVAGIGWGTRTTDYDAVKRQLIREMSPNQVAGFNTTYGVAKGKLYKAIKKWEDAGNRFLETGQHGNPRYIGLGDDGFGDLIAHIVGLGKKEYSAVLRNPQLAKDRADRGDFKESFSYAIPGIRDYQLLDLGHYQRDAEGPYELVEWLLGWLGTRSEAREVTGDLRVLYEGLGLLRSYQAHDFVAREDAIVGAAKKVEEWWDKLGRAYGPEAKLRDALYAAMPEKLMPVGHLYWAVRNVISDMKKYLFD